MKMTADVFHELIRSLRSNPPAAGEKRQKPRVGLRVRVEIALPDPATGLLTERADAMIRDVSATGIGLTVNRRLAAGSPLALLLDPDGGAQAADVRCTVVHCRLAAGDLYRVGARLDA